MSNNIKVHVISFVEKQSFFPVEIGVRLFELGIRWVRVAAMERSFRAQKENFLKWRNKEKRRSQYFIEIQDMYGTVGLDDGRPGAGQSGIEYLTAIIHECFPQDTLL